MSHVLLNSKTAKKRMVGKTIARIDARAVNVIYFYFTDGTAYAIETESFTGGITGMVGCSVCVGKEVSR